MNRIRKRRPSRRHLITETLETRHLLAGPYAPAAGQIGSEAIDAGSAQIAAWATDVVDYSPGANVDVDFQTPNNATGPSDPLEGDDSPIPDTVTLGDGGEITLTFADPIRDGIGDDFAVFENSFSDTFLELALVEVSTDGVTFVRFDNDSLTADPVEAFGSLDPTNLDGLAGKYRGGFGTGFDLADVGLDRVTHVRVVDIVGDGNTTDTSGDPIYDPFPGTGSAGFDLDAVAVIHQYAFDRDVVDFETLGDGLADNSFFNGPVQGGTSATGPFADSVVLGTFNAEMLELNNNHSLDFGSWNGFAYSNTTDATTAGFGNQHSAFPGSGADGSATYGVGFVTSSDFYDLPTIGKSEGDDRKFESVQITNTTYAALSMLNGDMFAKQFGGPTGNDPDFLSLTITGIDDAGNSIGDVEFFLADFRFDDNALDYIVDEWTTVDLTPIASAESLQFSIASSDVGSFGINTPTYFAIDDITLAKPVLPIGLADGSVTEDAGDSATTLRISRFDDDTTDEISVTLSVTDSGVIDVPATVVIPTGEAFVDVPVGVIDNTVLGDDRAVEITAAAEGFADATATLAIVNDDVALSLSVVSPTIEESTADSTGTLEDIGRGLAPESFVNQAGDAGFVSGSVTLNNRIEPFFGGWAVSNLTDKTTPGFTNQYAAITGIGSGDSDSYAVATAFPGGFVPTIVRDPATTTAFTSIDITNTTYAALSMRDGDSFAKQFGGTDGSDPDFFTLTIEGFSDEATSVGTIDVSLADFRFDDDTQDFILDAWQTVDLSPIGDATELRFSQSSSDVGNFGMNTPAYFAADNVRTAGDTALPAVTVTRETSDVSLPVEVSLTSSDPSEISLSSTVVIPAGQASVDVPFFVTPDLVTDGDQPVTINASAPDFAGASVDVTVVDSDVSELTLTLGSSEVLEDSGTTIAVVHRNAGDTTSPLEVAITSSDPALASVPETVTIPAGARSVSFDITITDNDEIGDAESVTINAVAGEDIADETILTINDEDALRPALTIALDQTEISESDARVMIDFESIGASIPQEGFNNGSDLSGGFQQGPVSLNNDFNTDFQSWSGFAISKVTDTETAGFTNQYSAIPGEGALSSDTYAVANTFGASPPTIELSGENQSFASIDVTNATYAALSMQMGDAFAKQFGGESGDDPDFFLLTITGVDEAGESVGDVEFYLSDFRFDDNSLDTIVDTWTTVDVSSLTGAVALTFGLSSSDNGDFGMNTPAYFAIDNIVLDSVDQAPAATATLTRENADTTEPLQVTISGGDASELSLPAMVEIPAGESSITFPVGSVSDSKVDGDQEVSLTAMAEDFRSATASVTVTDDDVPTLTLTLADLTIGESAGGNETSLLVHHNFQRLSEPLVFSISADGVTSPSEVSIPGGQSSASVTIAVIDNDIRDGLRSAVITVEGQALSEDVTLMINDDEVSDVLVSFDGESPLTITEAISDGSFDVTLSARPLGEVTVALESPDSQVVLGNASLVFTPENWDVSQTVSVSSPIDLLSEITRTITLTATATDADAAQLFDAVASSIEVAVEDYQSTNLVIAQDDTGITLTDVDQDQVIVSALLDDGINVSASDSDQTLSIEAITGPSGPVIVRTSGGDDRVVLRSDRFTLIDGGQGTDVLEIQIPGNVDLGELVDQRVFGFESYVLNSDSPIGLSTASLPQLVDGNGVLFVRTSLDTRLELAGEITAQEPTFVDGELRQMISAGGFTVQIVSASPWQNAGNRFDTNRSGDVTSLDALQVINQLARQTSPDVAPITSIDDFTGSFYDVNGDNQVSALDALQVINQIARQEAVPESERFDQAIQQWFDDDDETRLF